MKVPEEELFSRDDKDWRKGRGGGGMSSRSGHSSELYRRPLVCRTERLFQPPGHLEQVGEGPGGLVFLDGQGVEGEKGGVGLALFHHQLDGTL